MGEWPVSPVEKSQASEPIWRKTPAGQGGDADWNMSARKTSTAEDHAKVHTINNPIKYLSVLQSA